MKILRQLLNFAVKGSINALVTIAFIMLLKQIPVVKDFVNRSLASA